MSNKELIKLIYRKCCISGISRQCIKSFHEYGNGNLIDYNYANERILKAIKLLIEELSKLNNDETTNRTN